MLSYFLFYSQDIILINQSEIAILMQVSGQTNKGKIPIISYWPS